MSRQEDLNDRTQVQIHDPLVGMTFDGRFHIDFRIAVGGFGAIYHATHKKSGHQFALKILHARLASDPGVIARFRREGETLTRLRNPHTIIAYEMGEADDGTLFIVLELLHGESLFERFRKRGAFEWKQMAAIARGVCSSLEEAHELGIIHRDLKPTNINLESKDGDESFAKVLDFGIAKIIRDTGIDNADLTSAGQMIGTLDYMSPEQMVGGACTGQTDIYTLGIVMYEMIAGRRPFSEATSPAAVLAAMLRTLPAPLSSFVPVPPGLDTIVMKCLAREPEQRWSTVVDLGDALDRLLRGEEIDDGNDDVTRTVALPDGEESTVFEERRPLSTSPYPAQLVGPGAKTLGEAPTEPAPIVWRAAAARAANPLNATLAGRPAPPPQSNERTPTPVTNRRPLTEPPPNRGSQPALPTHGGRGSQQVFADADR
ncbi:protein kinase [soil metagenome]